jgi:hypothetical protein
MDNNKEMFSSNIPYLGSNTEHYIIECEKLGIIPFWNIRNENSFRRTNINLTWFDIENYSRFQYKFTYDDTIYIKNPRRSQNYYKRYSSILNPCLYPGSSTSRSFFEELALDNSYYITNSHFLAEVLEDKSLKVLYFLGVKTDKINQYASQTVLADNFSSDNFKYFVHEDFLKTSYHCKTMRSNWIKFKNLYLKDIEKEIIDDSFMDYFSSYSLPKFETLEDRKTFLKKIQSDFKESYFTSTGETSKTKEEIDEFIQSNLKLYSNIIEDQLEELSEEDMMLVAESGDEATLTTISNTGTYWLTSIIREVTHIPNGGIELDIEYTEDRSEGHAVQPPEENINF